MNDRRFARIHLFCAGFATGVAAFIFSMALIPGRVANLSDHDLQLANNLGFVFAPLVGFWVGALRRSLLWILLGISVGLAVGSAYRALSDYNFLAVMVVYPCLLGGVASAALGQGENSWFDGVFVRFAKGLVAGFVLGFVYMFLLNVIGGIMMPVAEPTVEDYRHMMWIAGTAAMGVGSGLFFVLFHWSANLDQTIPSFSRCTNPSQGEVETKGAAQVEEIARSGHEGR